MRYTDDAFATAGNFFAFQTGGQITRIDESAEEVTGKVTLEYDFLDDAMYYISATRGYKPGGTNLTFGFTVAEDAAAGRAQVAPLVFPTFEAETVDSLEFGLKADFYDGRARANFALFDYTYENLQVQATDPDVFWRVVNIPESEVTGVGIRTYWNIK